MKETVTRFAPSPTGRLHLGHAYSALFAAEIAWATGGPFLLRIEDIDCIRCRPEFEDGILEDMAWLGLEWEKPVRRQSDHLTDYQAALDRLSEIGAVYPCFCTRNDIKREIERAAHAPHGRDGSIYPGTCRKLPDSERGARMTSGESYAMRLDVGRASAGCGPLYFEDRVWGRIVVDPLRDGDVVIARKDIGTSYHLAVVVDDALQGVSCVTRGEDLLDATHIHRLLQALLDLPAPEYAHHGLLVGSDGKRFAKRNKATTLDSLRQSGQTPAMVRALAGYPDGEW
jgi:glutamyl-Q tRNA(Asp) synthetase